MDDDYNRFQNEWRDFLRTQDRQLHEDYEQGSQNKIILEVIEVCGTDSQAIYDEKFRQLLIRIFNERMGNEVFRIIIKTRHMKTIQEAFGLLNTELNFQEVKLVVKFFTELMAVSITKITLKEEIDDEDVGAVKNIIKYYPFLRLLK
jgi:hypothetical protein